MVRNILYFAKNDTCMNPHTILSLCTRVRFVPIGRTASVYNSIRDLSRTCVCTSICWQFCIHLHIHSGSNKMCMDISQSVDPSADIVMCSFFIRSVGWSVSLETIRYAWTSISPPSRLYVGIGSSVPSSVCSFVLNCRYILIKL